MPSATEHIDFLYASAATGAPVPQATIEWAAAAFFAKQLNPRLKLEALFGITSRGGIGGMSNQHRQDSRDRLLQELHRRFYSGLPPRAAARAILNLQDVKPRPSPRPDAAILLDTITRFGGRLPGERQLARILA